MAKKRILITNDDGFKAEGIQTLYKALKNDYDIRVVAPMYEKSGAGCSLSLSNEMEVHTFEERGKIYGYAVDGTPADCVKFAIKTLKDFNPEFVLSGINRGMNVGNSVFYSGTVAGAIEATLFGYPAMACSLACFGDPEYYFEPAAQAIRKVLPTIMKQKMPTRSVWNMNLPNLKKFNKSKIVYTTHGTSYFVDDFALNRRDGDSLYYKNVGTSLEACAVSENSDDRVLVDGDISLSLLNLNLTSLVDGSLYPELNEALHASE